MQNAVGFKQTLSRYLNSFCALSHTAFLSFQFMTKEYVLISVNYFKCTPRLLISGFLPTVCFYLGPYIC